MTTARLCALLLSLVLASGCAPQATRGGVTGDTRIDDAALSVGLDRVDIDFLVSENVHALSTSRFWNQVVEEMPEPPLVAIWPIENSTTQHLDDQMLTLLSSIETSLVNSGDVLVVSRSRQQELAREIGVQQGAIFDQSTAREMGRQLGAEFFVTGKITSVDERLKKVRRLQYSLFIQVIEIEKGLVRFQNEAVRTKQMKR